MHHIFCLPPHVRKLLQPTISCIEDYCGRVTCIQQWIQIKKTQACQRFPTWVKGGAFAKTLQPVCEMGGSRETQQFHSLLWVYASAWDLLVFPVREPLLGVPQVTHCWVPGGTIAFLTLCTRGCICFIRDFCSGTWELWGSSRLSNRLPFIKLVRDTLKDYIFVLCVAYSHVSIKGGTS